MRFIFTQIQGLGRSPMAERFALASLKEVPVKLIEEGKYCW